MKSRLLWAGLMILAAACSTAGPVIQAPSPTTAITAAPPTASSTPETPTATATELPPSATPRPSATAAPQASGPEDFPENVNPLTGLVVGDPDILDRRPLSVKVQMFPRGQRPPFGVSLADVVFDYYQNAGASRFNAIFYGQDAERVSPIRSGRLFDATIVDMFEAIFAFGSADERILNRIVNSPAGNRLVIRSSETCPPNPMCRVDPNGFNYLITDTALLSEYASQNNIDNTRPDFKGWRFDPETPQGGEEAASVFVRFNFSNYNRWDYDEESGRYLRFQETVNDEGQGEQYAPLVDGLTEEQIAADNVVVLFVTHDYAFNTRPGNNEIVDIQLTGSGQAYAFRDGQAYPLTWKNQTPDSLFTLTDASGEIYPLKPGNTWIQVVGQSSDMTQPESDTWRFTFSIP